MANDKENKYDVGKKIGAPAIFDNPEVMDAEISKYFQSLIDEEDPFLETPTLTGLALFLGFSSRQSLYDYKKKEEFSYMIKRATLVIENYYENRLGYKSPAGAIFALKNLGWSDKRDIDHTSNGESLNIPISAWAEKFRKDNA